METVGEILVKLRERRSDSSVRKEITEFIHELERYSLGTPVKTKRSFDSFAKGKIVGIDGEFLIID